MPTVKDPWLLPIVRNQWLMPHACSSFQTPQPLQAIMCITGQCTHHQAARKQLPGPVEGDQNSLPG